MTESNQTPETIRILIVDDHAVVRAGLRMLIDQNPEMKVVGLAGSCADALAIAASEQPNLIILDILLGEEDGLTELDFEHGAEEGQGGLVAELGSGHRPSP